MFTDNELLIRARKLFPEAKTDVDALNDYALYTFNSLKKYDGKKKLKAVFDETEIKYKEISALRKKLLLDNVKKEVKDEKEGFSAAVN